MKRRTFSKKGFVSVLPFAVTGRRLSSLIFIFISLLALSVSAISPQKMSVMRTGVLEGVAPILSVVGLPVQQSAAFVRDVSGLAGLQEENARLSIENEKLRKWYHAAMALKAENDSLRGLLNMQAAENSKFVSARILSDSGNRFVKSLVVHAGTNDGVERGYAALSGDGVIGRVVEVGPSTARILLITDINSRVPILIEDINQHGVMAGRNDVHPVLEHFPPNAEIDDGARVVTSGDGGVYPAGLPIGRVFYEDETFKVELFADFSRTTHVRMLERVDAKKTKSSETAELN